MGLDREYCFGVDLGRFGLHWEDIDEDTSVASLLAGRCDTRRFGYESPHREAQ